MLSDYDLRVLALEEKINLSKKDYDNTKPLSRARRGAELSEYNVPFKEVQYGFQLDCGVIIAAHKNTYKYPKCNTWYRFKDIKTLLQKVGYNVENRYGEHDPQ